MYSVLRQVGFVDVTTIVWVKRFNDSGQLICRKKLLGSVASPLAPWFRYACELIVVMKKSGGTFPLTHPPDVTFDEYADWTKTVWEIEPDPNRRRHPAPFPLELPWRLIKLFTVEGNVVLDPFIGSGTTMKACDALKRRCIGCEVSRAYIETSRQSVGGDNVQVVSFVET